MRDTERMDELERLLPATGANVLIERGERGRVSLLVSFGEREMKKLGTGKSVRAAIDDATSRQSHRQRAQKGDSAERSAETEPQPLSNSRGGT